MKKFIVKMERTPATTGSAQGTQDFEFWMFAHKKKCAIIVIFLGHGKLGKLAKLLFIDFAKPF